MQFEPCDWQVPDPVCCDAWDGATADAKARAKATAAALLWGATGYAFGRCPVTLRPCKKTCRGDGWPIRPDGRYAVDGWLAGVDGRRAAGTWLGVGCGCGRARTGSCSCTQVCEVELPGVDPEPTEVLVDGQVVPLDVFRVDNGRWLVWQRPCTLATGTVSCFPACQDLTKDDGCTGTWSVTYTHGIRVPAAGLAAASELACEVLKACGGDAGQCFLPANIQSMSRQGLEVVYATNIGALSESGHLRFNLPTVDMWVVTVNPHAVKTPAVAYSPDVPVQRVRTWP